MSGGAYEGSMRAFAVLLVCLILVVPINCAGESGVNEGTSLEGTSIQDIAYPSEASAGEVFGLTVMLSDEASTNGTTVSWITQICVNSGVCYAPVNNSMTLDEEGGSWEGTIIPDETVTYVNWRIEMNWEDGNTTGVPETGFGWKVWSDCWFDSGSWGGSDQECINESSSQGDSEESPGLLDEYALEFTALAIGAGVSILAITTAGLMGRRD